MRAWGNDTSHRGGPLPACAAGRRRRSLRCLPAMGKKEQPGAKLSFLNFSLHFLLGYYKIMCSVSYNQLHYFYSVPRQQHDLAVSLSQLHKFWMSYSKFCLLNKVQSLQKRKGKLVEPYPNSSEDFRTPDFYSIPIPLA